MGAACCLFRSNLAYRRDAFEGGLARAGYTVERHPSHRPERDDVLVLWNRRGIDDQWARRYEAAGAKVVIAENGYIGRAPGGGKLYALALNFHNGAGTWRTGGPERWDSLGVELAPFRAEGSFVLLLLQRGIGPFGVAQPRTWAADTVRRLQAQTKRPVVVRRHPGVEKADPAEALKGAWCAVTWASGAGIKALAAGIPVFYGLPKWIGRGAALPFGASLEHPRTVEADRLAMMRDLAWAQWTLAEIESGEAFAWLLR